MDVTPFWQPFQNVMAMQRATADRRVDLAQNNAVMDMKRQEFEMQRRQNALQMETLEDQRAAQMMAQERAMAAQRRAQELFQGGMTPQAMQTFATEFPEEAKPYLSAWKDTRPTFKLENGQYLAEDPGYGIAAAPIPGYQAPAPEYSADYRAFLDANFDGQNSAEAMAAFDRREIAMKRAGATNVSVNTGSKLGPLPQGYMAVPDARGGYYLARLPGHPDEAKELRRKESAARTGKTVIQDLERTLTIGGKSGVFGPPAIVTRNIPGTSTYTAVKMIDSALSNVGFDALQEMRQSSPTGGALGNVSDQEVTRLQQTLGSLDVTQPEPIVRDNIKRIINIYRDTVYGTPEQIRQLRDQGFIDPNRARDLSKRYELSFDEFGKPVKQGAPKGGAGTQQGNDLSRAAQEELRRRGL